jgi:hypothetical protein
VVLVEAVVVVSVVVSVVALGAGVSPEAGK